jgi:hypothetical protein
MIVIIGDSWGVGEWGVENNQYCLTGPGIGQYLMLTHRVVNLSEGAGSNAMALFRLSEFLDHYRNNESDTFYWIVTDPQRDVVDASTITGWANGIEQQVQCILLDSFDRANAIAVKHNIKLNLIGGLCDLDPDSANLYSNLNISVPSWTKLIDSNYNGSIMWGLNNPWIDLGELVKHRYPELLEEWLYLCDVITKKETAFGTIFKNYDYHPDRHGHLKLKNYLYPEYSNKY